MLELGMTQKRQEKRGIKQMRKEKLSTATNVEKASTGKIKQNKTHKKQNSREIYSTIGFQMSILNLISVDLLSNIHASEFSPKYLTFHLEIAFLPPLLFLEFLYIYS